MTAKKKKITEKGVLESTIRQFMTPQAMEDMKILMENPTLQQFLLRWQEADHAILGDQLKEELKEFLLEVYEKDNEQMCRNVTVSVCNQMEEFLTTINERLAELAKGQEGIAVDIRVIKVDLIDIKKRLQTDEDAITELWGAVRPLQRYASFGWTALRNLITAVVAVGMSIIAFLEIHSKIKP